MPTNEDLQFKKLTATTRIVADNGIGEVFPDGAIRQEIYNRYVPPGAQGSRGPQQSYLYQRVPPGTSDTAPINSTSTGRPQTSCGGCNCDERLKGLCDGSSWCPCCKNQSNGGPSSNSRGKISIPKFKMTPMDGSSGGTVGRSSGGGSAGSKSNAQSASKGAVQTNTLSVGSKYYPGGERGERNSKDIKSRRYSKDDDICADFPVSRRPSKRSGSDCLNQNVWRYVCPTEDSRRSSRNTFTVFNDAHQSPETSCAETTDFTRSIDCRNARVRCDPCKLPTQHDHPPSGHRLSCAVSPVTSTGCGRGLRSTRETRSTPDQQMMRGTSDENANCEPMKPNRPSILKELNNPCVHTEADLQHLSRLRLQNDSPEETTSPPPVSLFLALLIFWLLILSFAVYTLFQRKEVYDGIYA